MWAFLAKLIGGPIVKGLIDSYKLKLEAGNKTERIAADLAKEEIQADIQRRAIEVSLLRQEQGWWVTAMIRPLFAYPLILYWAKVIIWDKLLGWGTTDPLTGMIGEWAGWIILAYFGGRTVEKVSRQVLARR